MGKKEKELQAKEAELKRREKVLASRNLKFWVHEHFIMLDLPSGTLYFIYKQSFLHWIKSEVLFWHNNFLGIWVCFLQVQFIWVCEWWLGEPFRHDHRQKLMMKHNKFDMGLHILCCKLLNSYLLIGSRSSGWLSPLHRHERLLQMNA